MNEPKFTPGPWEVCNWTDVFTASGALARDGRKSNENDGWQIADCTLGITFTENGEEELTVEEQRANARLIAKAPEMYQLLRQMVESDQAGEIFQLVADAELVIKQINGEQNDQTATSDS